MTGKKLISASSLGILKGIYMGMPKNTNLPKKLLINNFFNSVGKETSRFG
jgi:import inner membrane translocase subunit TIM23